jgi:hypothetical protein
MGAERGNDVLYLRFVCVILGSMTSHDVGLARCCSCQPDTALCGVLGAGAVRYETS